MINAIAAFRRGKTAAGPGAGDGVTSIAAFALLFFLLTLRWGGFVHAVDIDGYFSAIACTGQAQSCLDIPPLTCCGFSGLLPRAVRIGYLQLLEYGVVYRGTPLVACDTSIGSEGGPGRKCLLGHGFVSGAEWYVLSDGVALEQHSIPACISTVMANAAISSSSSDSPLTSASASASSSVKANATIYSSPVPPTCTSTVMPNAIVYSSDSSRGKWVVEAHADTHDALLRELGGVEQRKKEEWLQSKGAYYVKEEEKGMDRTDEYFKYMTYIESVA